MTSGSKSSEKLGQGTRYVDLMNNDDVSGQKRKPEETEESQDSYVDSQESEEEQELSQSLGKLKMGDPILFYVIVFGNEPDEEKDVQCMKIGCFISQKTAGDHKRNTTRLVLLYRKHVQGNDAIGKALCTMLKQIYWFSARIKNCDPGNWKYLGPHCALVETNEDEGSEVRKVSFRLQNSDCFAAQLDCANPFFLNHQEVYRAYDSRPWPIARSSSVYDSKLFVIPRVLHEIVDKKPDAVNQVEGYRIFDFRGKLKVIAVPFIEGSHCPQSKEQLVVVTKYLKKMHDNGFVHGDIRLLNIVFTENPEDSQLIDFDFWG
jgi:hypothetical protein